MAWSAYAGDRDLIGEDDGETGRGGWHFRRGPNHVHRGIDLRSAVGHEVVAVEDGIAEYRSATVLPGVRGWNAAGHRVRLSGRSGAGYQYFHLGSHMASTVDAFPPGVRSGDVHAVRAGEVLGYAGHTGGSVATGLLIPASAVHLHFQYHPWGVDGEDRNPARLFERMGAPKD
ncbi:M23 family metallopeptidase [Streptomyces xanthophaeus]|uniref:M23 family metallopeptidase n=1 Tax=Streptomyces xanthophaeus TaxID=67385 RepID=UPI0039901D27